MEHDPAFSAAAEETKVMRILFLTPKPPYPPVDGSSLASWQMIEGLAARGHDVAVLYLTTPKHRDTGMPRPPRPSLSFTRAYADTSFSLVRLAGTWHPAAPPYLVRRFHVEEARRQLAALLEAQPYDVIQFEGLMMVPYLSEVRRLQPKAQAVYRAHNTEYRIWRSLAAHAPSLPQRLLYRLQARQLERYERHIARAFPLIVPISDDDAALFRGWSPSSRVVTIPYGVVPVSPLPPAAGGPPVLLFLGALDWRPNVQGLLWFIREVWPSLHQAFPAVRLRLAGRAPSPSFLHQLQALSHHDGSIEVLGEIAETTPFYRSGSLFLVPLLAGSGIRIKILEAMAHGLPVVSTSAGAAGLPVTHGKNIFIADRPEEMISAIRTLLHSPSLQKEIQENALTFVRERYNPKELITHLEKVYSTP